MNEYIKASRFGDKYNKDDTHGTYQISVDGLMSCPHLELELISTKVTALTDTGANVTLMSQQLYEQLVSAGLPTEELPVKGTILVSAFGHKTARIKLQALISFSIEGYA
jgi:hypothetical protein